MDVRSSKRVADQKKELSSKRSKLVSTKPTEISAFEALPRELQWKIIDHAPGSVVELRMSSGQLKKSVDAYALTAATITFVDNLKIDDVVPLRLISYEISMKRRVSQLFELRLALRQPSDDSRILLRRKYHKGNVVYKLHVEADAENDEILRSLGDCLGRRIDSLSLSNYRKGAMLDGMSQILEGIQIRFLSADNHNLPDFMTNHLLQTIISHNVESLHLSVDEPISNPGVFLLDLSSHLKSLTFGDRSYLRPNERKLLGVEGEDWGPIFLEMFSRKLDKLRIDNWSFPRYLKDSCASLLVERLPLLEKKIWFSTTCASFPDGLSSKIADSVVNADSEVLTIKHLSRMEENFYEDKNEDSATEEYEESEAEEYEGSDDEDSTDDDNDEYESEDEEDENDEESMSLEPQNKLRVGTYYF